MCTNQENRYVSIVAEYTEQFVQGAIPEIEDSKLLHENANASTEDAFDVYCGPLHNVVLSGVFAHYT